MGHISKWSCVSSITLRLFPFLLQTRRRCCLRRLLVVLLLPSRQKQPPRVHAAFGARAACGVVDGKRDGGREGAWQQSGIPYKHISPSLPPSLLSSVLVGQTDVVLVLLSPISRPAFFTTTVEANSSLALRCQHKMAILQTNCNYARCKIC